MQEQTKVTILLFSVIIIAVVSLIFIFYQYGKIQTQFTAKIAAAKTSKLQTQTYYSTKELQQPKTQICQKPNCSYNSHYRIGLHVIETGSQDIIGHIIKKSNQENPELLANPTNMQQDQELN